MIGLAEQALGFAEAGERIAASDVIVHALEEIECIVCQRLGVVGGERIEREPGGADRVVGSAGRVLSSGGGDREVVREGAHVAGRQGLDGVADAAMEADARRETQLFIEGRAYEGV